MTRTFPSRFMSGAIAAAAVGLGGVAAPPSAWAQAAGAPTQQPPRQSDATSGQGSRSGTASGQADRLERAAERLERATDRLTRALERMEQQQQRAASGGAARPAQADRAQGSSPRPGGGGDDAAAARQDAADVVGIITIAPVRQLVPDGMRITPVRDADGIREALADVTEAALTAGEFEDVVDQFVDFDRDRIGDFADRDFPELDGVVNQVRKLYRDRYGAQLQLDEGAVFGAGFDGFQIVQAESVNPVFLSAHWPIEPTPGRGGQIRRDVPLQRDGDGGFELQDSGDRNLEAGRELAVVAFPARHGLPTLHVSMIDELFGWKIDVPDQVSGRQVHRSLRDQLTYAARDVDNWPADAREAQRYLAHRVLLAVYGVDEKAARQRQQAEAEQQQRQQQQQAQQGQGQRQQRDDRGEPRGK